MSWSASLGPVAKCHADIELEQLQFSGDVRTAGPAFEQFQAARLAAKALLRSVPGPYISITMSGHANGTGWQPKEGWSNDTIYISVCQVTEPPKP